MKTKLLLLAATGLAFAPSLASAQTAPGQGQYNGQGYNHTNGPTTTGQPDQSCEALIASGLGGPPGSAHDNGSSAFGGTASTLYAGSQPQNSRNTASVSQYDVACLHQQSN